MRKKAQAAMEFLMTYGWAILVVLAAIGALAYLGILNPANWVQGRCDLQSDIRCSGDLVKTDTDIIVFEVLVSSDLKINGAEFIEDGTNLGCVITEGADLGNSGTNLNTTPTDLLSGRSYEFFVDCAGTDLEDPSSGTLSFLYEKGSISQNRTLTGRLVNIK